MNNKNQFDLEQLLLKNQIVKSVLKRQSEDPKRALELINIIHLAATEKANWRRWTVKWMLNTIKSRRWLWIMKTKLKSKRIPKPRKINSLTFLFVFFWGAFLQWQVVTGMEAEQIMESLANYIRFLRVPNAVRISHLLLIDRRTPVNMRRHKFAFYVTFKKLIIFVNAINTS